MNARCLITLAFACRGMRGSGGVGAAAPPSAPARTPEPTKAPPPTVAVLSKPGAISQSGASDIKMAPPRVNQMIIKNSEMNLLVADVDVALDRATGIAVELGG